MSGFNHPISRGLNHPISASRPPELTQFATAQLGRLAAAQFGRPVARRLRRLAVLVAPVLALALTGPALAHAASPAPHWTIKATSQPTYFRPAPAEDQYFLVARNNGAQATSNGSTTTIVDTLPPGVAAKLIEGEVIKQHGAAVEKMTCSVVVSTVTCTYKTELPEHEPLENGDLAIVVITVSVAPGAASPLANSATVFGGGAPSASVSEVTPINTEPVPFGLPYFTTDLSDASGSALTQAGSHPFELTTSLAFNVGAIEHTAEQQPSEGILPGPLPFTAGDMKDLNVALPPGVVGNPNAVPQCSQAQFAEPAQPLHGCPLDTQVGTVTITINNSNAHFEVKAVYNVTPPPGQPAELGFTFGNNFHIPIFFHVRSEGDYGLTAQLANVTEADPVRGAMLTIWGVPADTRHDRFRIGRELTQAGTCEHRVNEKEFFENNEKEQEATQLEKEKLEGEVTEAEGKGEKARQLELEASKREADARIAEIKERRLEHEVSPGKEPGCADPIPVKPFLTAPTSCESEPLAVNVVSDSWQNAGQFVAPSPSTIPAFTGCENLSLSPSTSIAVQPETTQAVAPSGYTVDLKVPQNESPSGLATPDVKNVTVSLPAGTVVSPSAADGLQGCSDAQFALHSLATATCPAASQIGTVRVHTPLLASELEGQVFLGSPLCAPCGAADAAEGRMVRLFLQIAGSGVIVKLKGHTAIDQGTGRLTTTFANNPQLPFDELKLTLDGGPRAPLANPVTCGMFTTTAELTPWSAPFSPDATPSSAFEITGCGPPRFAPSFSAGTTNNHASAFSPLSVTFGRTDADQYIDAITLHTPPGLLGTLAEIQLCPEPQASNGTCGPQSRIGSTTVGAGPGSNPFYEGGNVFLTGPYKGAPFGLSIVVHALAGPFDLGNVIVRAAIEVDRNTSALTVTSDPLPRILDGVPLQIKTVNVSIDRENFIFNTTNCESQTIAGTLRGAQGTTAAVSSRYQAADCASLPFTPSFTVHTQAKTSKANGASLSVRVTSGPGQANIGKARVILPKQLPARLTTLQKACVDSVFNANPAGCPPASVVGSATAVTPVLKSTLTGPAYLVSHGGAAFPDLVVVLQGEGITLYLDGNTNIKNGVTSSTFNSVPDAPITTFELALPEGPHSALTATASLCAKKLVMPTTLTGQNGARFTQATKIAVSGCAKPKKHGGKPKKHGKKQQAKKR